MRRFRLLPTLIFTSFIIAYIGMSTNWLIGTLLFLGVIVLPVGYIVFVYYYGAALAMRGHMAEAIRHYTRLLKFPFVDKVQLYARRAALYNAVGNIDGAIKDYSAIMALIPSEDASLYAIRSALYLGKRDFNNALKDSSRLIELRPKSEMGYANRAAARMFLGDIDGAIVDCNTGLEQQPAASGKALLHNNLGTAYRMRGEFTDAMMNYNLAMGAALSDRERFMIHPSIITNQGILYHLQREYDSAKAYFQQAISLNPGFYKSLVGLATARFKLGQIGEAHKLWRDLLQKEPRYQDERFLQRDLNLPLEMMTDVGELVESLST